MTVKQLVHFVATLRYIVKNKKIKLKNIDGSEVKEYYLVEMGDNYVKVTDPEIGGVFTFNKKCIVNERR